jgi:hypothetical protein
MSTAKEPLANRLENAILQIVMQPYGNDGTHPSRWGDWMNDVRQFVPEVTQDNLKAAFKRLWRQKIVHLTKAGLHYKWSDDENEDVEFFFREPFRVSITEDGRKYWDIIRLGTTGNPIGFAPQ